MLERPETAVPTPFVSSVMRVEPGWIDYNGHLNMAYYNVLFDRAGDEAFDLLGCGAGYFAYIAQLLGHDVLGLDIDDVPMFAEITQLLGVRRVIWRIHPFVPLPELGEKFDLITAFLICFNNHKQSELWGVPEWEFFLNDLARDLMS